MVKLLTVSRYKKYIASGTKYLHNIILKSSLAEWYKVFSARV